MGTLSHERHASAVKGRMRPVLADASTAILVAAATLCWEGAFSPLDTASTPTA